jgi:succinate dehydrogenase/fumarate reductase cytochrome b subunit
MVDSLGSYIYYLHSPGDGVLYLSAARRLCLGASEWVGIFSLDFLCPGLTNVFTSFSWFIGASAGIAGSLCAFVLSRSIFSRYVSRLVSADTRFAALALVLKHEGLGLLVMIRLCPLPFSLTNGALSTIRTIRPWTFALATALASPKILIHVFVGERLANLAKHHEKMDAKTKAINYASIAGGTILGLVTGWIIYQRTMARSKQLEDEERKRLEEMGSGGRDGLAHPDEFLEESDDDERRLMGEDDIDFVEEEPVDMDGRYHDEGPGGPGVAMNKLGAGL